MAIRSKIARLERAGWKVTRCGGPFHTPLGDEHVSWIAAWSRPWADDPGAQVQIEVNCRGTPEAALSRLFHLAEVIASDEASATATSHELEEVAALASCREGSLAAPVGARTDLSQ